jgi:N-acetyl-gamma-glutamylphosphate reductase
MIDEAASADPRVLALLKRHPKVAAVREGAHSGVDFRLGEWRRSVLVGDLSAPIAGLVELMDNNPMVCADVVSVPSAAATAALVSLGPLAWAGLIREPPVVVAAAPAEEELASWLASAGWKGGVTAEIHPLVGPCVSLTAIASIDTPDDWLDIDALYDERFARSFFVRRVEEWSPDLAAGQPFAAYQMQYTPGDAQSLLRISVSADRDGKAGAAQVIHAMNVMAGFEESLGVA